MRSRLQVLLVVLVAALVLAGAAAMLLAADGRARQLDQRVSRLETDVSLLRE